MWDKTIAPNPNVVLLITSFFDYDYFFSRAYQMISGLIKRQAEQSPPRCARAYLGDQKKNIIETATDVKLRDEYSLKDGDVVEVSVQ